VDLASNKRHIDIMKDWNGVAMSACVGARHGVPSINDGTLRIHLALGLHPGNIKTNEIDPCFSFFREVLDVRGHMDMRGHTLNSSSELSVCHRITRITRPVAIGETGLDFMYKWVRKEDALKNEQRMVFQRHLDLAKEFDLPIVIHCRGAWREALQMTIASGVKKAVFHWYSGPIDVLKDILDAGFLISVSTALAPLVGEGSHALPNTALPNPALQKIVEYTPLDRILVETDTPVRGWTPKDVWRTFKALCAIKGLDEEKALAVVNANARAFFNI